MGEIDFLLDAALDALDKVRMAYKTHDEKLPELIGIFEIKSKHLVRKLHAFVDV